MHVYVWRIRQYASVIPINFFWSKVRCQKPAKKKGELFQLVVAKIIVHDEKVHSTFGDSDDFLDGYIVKEWR